MKRPILAGTPKTARLGHEPGPPSRIEYFKPSEAHADDPTAERCLWTAEIGRGAHLIWNSNAAMFVLITGSSGLIGSEAVVYYGSRGWTVHGIDNNQRRAFFGPPGDTTQNLK